MSVEFNRQEWLENNRDKIADLSALRRAGQPTDPLILECARQMTHETPQPKAASWHACFIAEQRAAGQVQPHLLAMLEVLLQEAEKAYGEPLPKPGAIDVTKAGAILFEWQRGGNYVGLIIWPNGETTYNRRGCLNRGLTDPAQLAATLRELWPKEEA